MSEFFKISILDLSLYKFNFTEYSGTKKFELNLLYEYETRITKHLLPYKSN